MKILVTPRLFDRRSLIFLLVATFQIAVRGESTSPSLDETLEWLVNTGEARGFYVESASYKGGVITWSHRASPGKFASTPVVPLRELDPNQVKVTTSEVGMSTVSIMTRNNRKVISLQTHGEFGKSWQITEESFQLVQDNDGSMADRVAQAFRHAIILSGGKVSDF